MNTSKMKMLLSRPSGPGTCRFSTRCTRILECSSGYTLVELMIVISILGIVLAAAVPAYSGFTRSSREMQATTKIQKIALKLEQHYTETMSYQTEISELDVPARDSWYQYRVDSGDRKQYTIYASPLVANSSRREFSLDQHGLQRHRQDGSADWIPGWSSS